MIQCTTSQKLSINSVKMLNQLSFIIENCHTHTHKHTAHVHQHLYQNYVDDQISNSLCKINSNIKLTRVKKKGNALTQCNYPLHFYTVIYSMRDTKLCRLKQNNNLKLSHVM